MLATACKLDERQIHATTLAHFRRLERYWADHPPEHLIGRAFIKVKGHTAAIGTATKISPDARSAEERSADVARIAAIRAKAPAPNVAPGGLAGIMAAAKAKGGKLNLGFDALKGIG